MDFTQFIINNNKNVRRQYVVYKNTISPQLRADFALVRHLTDCFAATTWPFPSLLLGWLTDFFLDGLARLDLLAALLGLLQLAPRPLDLDTVGGGREDNLPGFECKSD